MSRRRLAVLAAGVLTAVTGCGGSGASAPTAPAVQVTAGSERVTVQPTQYCLQGHGRRYTVTPPIIQVDPDTPLTLHVPPEVADQGWSVQVFDTGLENTIGEVDVPAGTATFSGINSSDVVPAGFYLVVVEKPSSGCSALAGAWPVGFIRTGGDPGAPAGTAPASG